MADTGVLWPIAEPQEFEEYAQQRWQFSDVVDPVGWPLQATQLGLILSNKSIAFLALARRGPWVATRKRRISFRPIRSIEPVALEAVASRMPDHFSSHLWRVVGKGGGVVPPATWNALLTALFELSDEARTEGSALLDMISRARRREEGLDPVEALERDAVMLALSIAGMQRDRAPLLADGPAHFLADIEQSIPEDALIVHDASRMPGFEFMEEFPGVALQFRGQRDGHSLTVMNVNRRPLETTTGVDLVYYRHEPDAFVLVQYKRFANESGRWVYRPAADRHLAKEIARMEAMKLPTSTLVSLRDYRLSDKPFYIKLCRPVYAELRPDRLVPGMYIPLEYWKALGASPATRGPRGGTVLSYDTVDRWLTNTQFADLVREAWIGTSGAASREISKVIRASLSLGKSAIVALESGSAARRRRA